MIGTILFTVALILGGWWFFFKKTSGRGSDEQQQLSKNQEKKLKREAAASKKQNEKEVVPEQPKKEEPKEEPKTKHKNKADHPFFFKSFKKNNANIVDFDISLDNHFLAIASKDRNHIVYNIKEDTTEKFTTNTLPQRIAISEHGNYLATSHDLSVTLYHRETSGHITTMRTFEVCKDCLLGLYISEEPQMIITAGSYHHCNFHIVDFKGAHLRPPVQSDISDGISVVTEKHTRRSVYLSESSEIRVFRATTSVKNEFKDFGKEHSMFGHKGKVLGVTFSADGSRAYSLSSDKTLKEWDLKMEGFSNSHIKCLNTWPIEPSLVSEDSQLQWCGHDSSSSDHETQHLCISTGDKLHFLDCTGSDLKMRESIEEAHQGDNISRLTYIYDPRSDKKGILFSKSEKRLYGWKPKFT